MLKKTLRFPSRSLFKVAVIKGRFLRKTNLFTLKVLELRDPATGPFFGVVVSKKRGKANKRILLKRRFRGIINTLPDSLKDSYIGKAFVFNMSNLPESYEDLKAEIYNCLDKK